MESLFKFGNFDFTNYIQKGSFDITPNARLDRDSYTDANGLLHRNTLSHTSTQISFVTPLMPESAFSVIMEGMRGNYISEKERNAQCTYYDPEYGTQKIGNFYLDANFKTGIDCIMNGEKYYKETTFSFVEY